MKWLSTWVAFPVTTLLVTVLFFNNNEPQTKYRHSPATTIRQTPRIQAAILLDVSSSMDGLINQAKLQLWNMVSVMAKGECNGVAPEIELALYEYGRQNGDKQNGYIKQLSPFTQNLDSLSTILFGLTTYGGLEYCGQVIFTSLNELNWDKGDSTYKVIFIAGNEDFLQGTLPYTQACQEAIKKSVIVNTIYCGPREQGIREHWNLNGDCGSGSFTNINQNASIDDIATPYDSALLAKNNLLNNTYIGYGSQGELAVAQVKEVDSKTYSMNKSSAVSRTKVKASAKVYNNASWDMIDAAKKDENFVASINKAQLPDSLKNKTTAQLKELIREKAALRDGLQKEILSLSMQRDAWLQQKKNEKLSPEEKTLQSEIEKIIRNQAKNFGIKID